MAKGNSVYRSNDAEGAVVIGASVYDVPLLPYERQLIATIGITEEEYRAFTAEVRRRGAVRPAAYDHIPDVQNAEPVVQTFLINLAISLVLTGVSYLLTPKPKMPRAQGGGSRDLGSLTGASRFTPSRGFETLSELADYASPVPLIFGLYKDDIGGMLVTPKLIWSRMFSHGTMQRAKLMFVVGEQGITELKNDSGSFEVFEPGISSPELDGIFLGNNALDAIFEDYFAFYWHGDSSVNLRINGADKQYGTRGKAHGGDPDVPNDSNVDVFDIPTSDVVNAQQEALEPGEKFCHAYTPSNNTSFGVYSTIANGTSYRVNYQLIPIDKDAEEKPRVNATLQRIKIVGDSGVKINGGTLQERGIEPGSATTKDLDKIRKEGSHKGAGRNYSPRMGIIKAKGQTVSGNNLRDVVSNVEKGDKATFVIRNSKIDEDFYHKSHISGTSFFNGRHSKLGPSVDDINSTIETFQLQADSIMQLGEHFEIGGSIWKVINRKEVRFDPDTEKDQIIELQCTDSSVSILKQIGIVSDSNVVEPSDQFIGDSGVGDTSKSIDEVFFPVSQVSVASFKNNRPCVVTEVGIKSKVFQRLNGLCNFQTLPDTEQLKELEDDNVQITTGTMNINVTRTSVFRVLVKEVGSSKDFSVITSNSDGPLFFAVRGHQPTDQYNSIRFTTQSMLALEYKFVPVSGAEMGRLTGNELIVELSSSTSIDQNENGSNGSHEISCTVAGHNMLVFFSGRKHKGGWSDHLFINKEFIKNGKFITPFPIFDEPDLFTVPVFIEGTNFGDKTQISDISTYRDLVDKSNSGSPEHEIVYVNEVLINDQKANLTNLTLVGLSLKAGREYTSLDQLRCWLANGMVVERLHPGNKQIVYGSSKAAGPSNLFTDLVYFLLTDQVAGAGGLLGMNPENDYLVDKKALEKTSRFLFKQKLFFNGPITDRSNLRDFIAQIAPNFLCNFVIENGKYSLTPAVPTNDAGEIKSGSTEPVRVKQIFSAGNIIQDSYKLDYLGSEERRSFKAVVRFRQERKNKLPEEQVIIVTGSDASDDFKTPGTQKLPEEQFDLTQFCTTREHAYKVARYFLALRAYVTHTISFSTTAEGLNIGAGSYIKVFTEASPYNSANTGTVNSSGVVTSVRDLPDGTYNVVFFKTGSNDVSEGFMQVSNNKVANSAFHDVVFTVQDSNVSENIYVVEQLTFSQDGLVDIVASEHACDDNGVSKIAKAVDGFEADATGFTIES